MEENNNWNNMSRVVANRAKRGDAARARTHRNRTSRVNPVNISRAPTYIDDVTLNAMIASGMMEALAPVHFAQFRVPMRQTSETNQNDGAAHIDYRLNWIPKNINLSNAANEKEKEGNSKFRGSERNALAEFLQEDERPRKDPRYLLPRLIMEEEENVDEIIRVERRETIMQWFDKAVEQELSVRRRPKISCSSLPSFPEAIKPLPKNINQPNSILETSGEGSSNQKEVTIERKTEVNDEAKTEGAEEAEETAEVRDDEGSSYC